jgi:prepilin-type N-terminal cleavage/methylation domain-containing protein
MEVTMQDIRRASGFTLIELLVVIAIIATLAAILFPVFAAARSKAKQTQCSSNIKQLNIGMMLYVGDHDDRMITYHFFNYASGYTDDLRQGSANKYIRSPDVFRCPADNMDRWDWANWGPDMPKTKGTYSYAINSYLTKSTPYGWSDTYQGKVKLSYFQEPARTPSFVEEKGIDEWSAYDPGHLYWGVNDSRFGNVDETSGRHHGKCSVAHLDGHVKTVKGDLIWLYARNDDGTFWCCPPVK